MSAVPETTEMLKKCTDCSHVSGVHIQCRCMDSVKYYHKYLKVLFHHGIRTFEKLYIQANPYVIEQAFPRA